MVSNKILLDKFKHTSHVENEFFKIPSSTGTRTYKIHVIKTATFKRPPHIYDILNGPKSKKGKSTDCYLSLY